MPNQRISANEAAWKFQGSWQAVKNGQAARAPGDEATLKFTGVAVAILGPMNQNGGRAQVFIDGKRQKQPLDAYVPPRTHDNVLWAIYGLKPGEHTLRIVTLDPAASKARGSDITIEQAVTYTKP